MNENNLLDSQSDETTVNLDPDKNYFEELVGEGKKFKDSEALAKSKFYADEMVKIQNKRLDVLREDYLRLRNENQAKAKLEELIDRLQNQQLSNRETPLSNEVKDEKPQFDLKEIESLVSSKLQEHEATRKQQENFNQVKVKLEQRFGKNYQESLKQQMDELDISEEDLNQMARNRPKALLRTLGLDQQPNQEPSFNAPPRSQQRKDNFAPTAAAKRTWAYYDALKQKDQNAWLDPKIAVQMQKDALELGESFYDGNFYVAGLHER